MSDEIYNEQNISDNLRTQKWLAVAALVAEVTGKPRVLRCAITELSDIAHTIEVSHVVRGGLPRDTVSANISTPPTYSVNV